VLNALFLSKAQENLWFCPRFQFPQHLALKILGKSSTKALNKSVKKWEYHGKPIEAHSSIQDASLNAFTCIFSEALNEISWEEGKEPIFVY